MPCSTIPEVFMLTFVIFTLSEGWTSSCSPATQIDFMLNQLVGACRAAGDLLGRSGQSHETGTLGHRSITCIA